MKAYYNDNDKYCVAWLKELINAKLIMNGDIDDRSIADVTKADISGYTQCHFFAGIGGWPYALQLANWPTTRSVWTGSCPCQPFSAIGLRQGTCDERHVWPEFARLIKECEPSIIFGEQVASKAGREWLSGIRIDLETLGYGVGAADLCASCVNSPHIRQRLYWVADLQQQRLERYAGNVTNRYKSRWNGTQAIRPIAESSRNCHAWSEFDIIPCGDGKTRRIEPGTFPLAYGVSGRVGLLRGYGNAIVPQVAAEFIKAFTECNTGYQGGPSA